VTIKNILIELLRGDRTFHIHFDVDLPYKLCAQIEKIEGVAYCRCLDRYTIGIKIGELFTPSHVLDEIIKKIKISIYPTCQNIDVLNIKHFWCNLINFLL